ncbi:zinc transporter ZIP3 isoform X1 [Procambarus clarkii]|uniref:zinc transporter ZIP3 isoform X1 n=1 Tax=Procambarus clarkii TaxID=6728 RepID=UPI003743CDBC
MELLTTKIIALTLMGALSLVFGLLPLRLRKCLAQGSRRRERTVSCLLCFGGGVLLATVFTHMLPETRESFSKAFQKKLLSAGAHYPLAELVTCAGFFLIYFVEEFVHKIFLRRDSRHARKLTKLAAAIEEETNNPTSAAPNHHHHHHHNGTSHHHHHLPHAHINGQLDHKETSGKQLVDDQGDKQLQESARCSVYSVTASGTSVESKGKPGVLSPKSRWAETGVDNPVFAGDFDAAAWNPALKEAIISGTQVTSSELQGTGRGPVVAPEAPQGGHHHHGGHHHAGHGHSHLGISKLGSKGIAFNLRSLLVILALSFHSVFEGLAVGLQENDTDVWYLLLAICAHKFVIAFCVGLELLAGGTSAGLMVVYMVVFALVSPLGIAIGIVVTENLSSEEEGHLVAVTILQGLAGGTILYVTFFEVLERERGRGGGRILKFLFVLMGFGAMASLEAIGGHSHGPSEGDCHGHSHGDILATTTSSTTDDHDHDHHDHDHHDHDHHDHEHTH